MKQKPKLRHAHFTSKLGLQSAAAFAGLFLAHSSLAAITTWTGDGGDDQWSTSTNWSDGLPAGNDVVFAAQDATGTPGASGTPNNLVDANTTVLSLIYTNLETTGNHTTQIPAGVTLTVNGGGTSIEARSPTTGNADVVYATILGEGTLTANNSAATLYVGQGAGTGNTTRRATLDMSGLEEFSATLNQVVIGRQVNTAAANRPQGTLRLARTNTLTLSANPGILLGSIVQNNGTTADAQILELGVSNTILSNNGISIGARKGNGYVRFNSEMVAEGQGSAVFRDLAGTGRQTNWLIGDNSPQSGGGTLATGAADFSIFGEVDALVTNLVLGRGTAGNASNANFSTGVLTFDKGTINTNSLSIGIQPNDGGGNARGTVNVDGTGKLLVNGDTILGRYLGGTNNLQQGILNIGLASGGGEIEIRGDVLCGLGGSNDINVGSGGVLRIGGVVGTPGGDNDGSLATLGLNNATLAINLGTGGNPINTRINVQDLSTTGTVDVLVTGSNLTPGTVRLVEYLNLDGAGFAAFNLLPTPGLQAVLVDNAAEGAVDLLITAVTGLKWNGTVNGDWDINGTVNWELVPGGTPSTYQESSGGGPRAIFDDTAIGTKTVNLTTIVSPLEAVVETAQTYIFTGSGGLDGAAGLVKRGSGTLVLENTGTNGFSGPVDIEGGTLRLANSDDRLPVSAVVTLDGSAGAQLDLNGTKQTISSLAGDGNVLLGAGTLTLIAAGSYDGVIQGSGSLVKSGAGNHVLSGANTFAGGATITGGRIVVTNASGSGLGSGPVVIESGGSLAIGNAGETGSISAPTISNDGLVLINRSDDITLESEITGTGALTKNGEGTLLIESANSYQGFTTVNAGALRVTHPLALGTATDIEGDRTTINNPMSARLEISGGITLAEPIQLAQKQNASGEAACIININGDNTLTGPIKLVAGGSNWNIWSDDGKLTISGTISNTTTTNTRNLRFFGYGDGEILSDIADGDGTSLTAIFMNGGGAWRLAGNNSYSGPTDVTDGTLQIDGTQTASVVTVNPDGTLSGSGTLGTVNATGTIAPGAGIGTMNAAQVTLGGTLAIEVVGASADRLNVSGTLDLTGAIVTVSGTPTAGSYTLASAGTLIGVPLLFAPVPNYEMVVDGNTLKLNSLAGGSAYDTWAGGSAFGDDENGDGVSNGLAFLLGAANPGENAINRLPVITQSGGGLVLTFSMLNAASREGAALSIEHSSDLGSNDPWTAVAVPDVSGGPIDGVSFVITPGDPLNTVQASISAGEAVNGKLFGRLKADNP